VPAFLSLGLDNLMTLFTALLLEKPIVVLGKSLTSVSSVVLSIIPLIRPLVWQGLHLPILPMNLKDILHAPVPYVAGIQEFDEKDIEAILFNLDDNKVQYFNLKPMPKIPEEGKLLTNVKKIDLLTATNSQQPFSEHPFGISAEQMKYAKLILENFVEYSNWILGRVQTFYSNHAQEPDMRVIQQAFLKTVSPVNKTFIEGFTSAQHMSVYLQKNKK